MTASAGTRIVVRGVNWLGDAVMTTPALLRLREAFQSAEITLLTPEKLHDLWRYHPALDATLTVSPRESPFAVAQRLRGANFDWGVVFPNSFRSALELWWARIPHRIGYAGQLRTALLTQAARRGPGALPMRKRSVAEIHRLVAAPASSGSSAPAAGRIGTAKEPAGLLAHHIHQYLHLVSELGANPAPLAPYVRVLETEVEAFHKRFELDCEHPLYGLIPGAEYGSAKRWPIERFIAAARQIQESTHCRWLIFGGPADIQLASEVVAGICAGASSQPGAAHRPAALSLAGRTSLRELCAGCKSCRVVLTNDTGPMHVAAAVGTPVVALFGSTSPAFTAPGLPGDPRLEILQSSASCAPCFLRKCPIDFRCMEGIDVSQVTAAVLQLVRRQ